MLLFSKRKRSVTLLGASTLALAVAATSAALVWLRMPHPPAGATTLIVALGLITGTRAAVLIPAGVVLVTVVAWLVNRSLGEPVAVWFRSGGVQS